VQFEVVEDVIPAGPLVGTGALPAALDQLNWGALLLPGWWSFVHGTWSWFALLLGWRVVYWFAAVTAYGYLDPPSAYYAAAFLALAVASWVLWVAFALRANRLFWEHEQRRVRNESDASVPRLPRPVATYQKSQRTWAIVGAVVFVAEVPWIAYTTLTATPDLMSTWLVRCAVDVAVLVGVFIFSRSRRQRADAKLTRAST
jgi:hypothetical protein